MGIGKNWNEIWTICELGTTDTGCHDLSEISTIAPNDVPRTPPLETTIALDSVLS